MINREIFLLILAISAEHLGRPLKYEDMTVVSMKSSGSFKGDDIKQEIEKSIKEIQSKPEYVSAIRLIISQMEFCNQNCCNFHFFGCMYTACRIDKMSNGIFHAVLLPENCLFARKSRLGSKFANLDLLIALISYFYGNMPLFLK